VLHAVVQDLDHIRVVNLDLKTVHILAVNLVQEVVRLQRVIQDLIADLGLTQHLVPNGAHNLVLNLSRYQDHQSDQNLEVVQLLIHQLIQELHRHPIRSPNPEADILLDLGKYTFLWYSNSVIIV